MRTSAAWHALSLARDPFDSGVMPMTHEEAAEYRLWLGAAAFGVHTWPLQLRGRRIVLAESPIPWRLPNDRFS